MMALQRPGWRAGAATWNAQSWTGKSVSDRCKIRQADGEAIRTASHILASLSWLQQEGRIPAAGLGDERPEQHAHLWYGCSVHISIHSFSRSLTRFLSSSRLSSRVSASKKGTPSLHRFTPLSPPSFVLFRRVKIDWHIPSSAGPGSCSIRLCPLGLHIITPPSASLLLSTD